MTTPNIATEGTTGSTPIACSLTSADLAAQASRWRQLAADAMTERAETADGLRISFRPAPGVERELANLVAVENECCRWATWTVNKAADQIELRVSSAGEGIATLHHMFTDLQHSVTARSSQNGR